MLWLLPVVSLPSANVSELLKVNSLAILAVDLLHCKAALNWPWPFDEIAGVGY